MILTQNYGETISQYNNAQKAILIFRRQMSAKSPAIDPTALGNKLKRALKERGQTPNWLAEQSGVGVRTIYSVLNGHQLPSIDKLRRLSKALNLSVDWLFDIENDAYYIFPDPGKESLSYAEFEEFWLGEGGERISVSRGFSIVHQPEELRRQILANVYGFSGEKLESAIEAFCARRAIIDRTERRRMEYVVKSEIEDFVYQRSPWDRVESSLVEEFVRGIIERLHRDRLGFEVHVIPRQNFLVNYEILNREVILFDLGTVFMRQRHDQVLNHFLTETEEFSRHPETTTERSEVIAFLESLLTQAPIASGYGAFK